MSSATIDLSSIYAPGTSVGAYARAQWPQSSGPPSGAPEGAAVDTQLVGANGKVTFANLVDDGTRYRVYGAGVVGPSFMARDVDPPDVVGSTGQVLANQGPVVSGAAYIPGDVVAQAGKRILIRKAVSASTGTNPTVAVGNGADPNYIVIGRTERIYATDHGFAADGNQATASANDTALAAAVNYCLALGGGTVVLPGGTGYFSAPLPSAYGVWMEGQGARGTYLRQKDGANITTGWQPHVSTGSGDANGAYAGLLKLTLDGNVANNATSGHGITMVTNPLLTAQGGTTSPSEQFDQQHVLEDVIVRKWAGDGVHATGRSAMQWKTVRAEFNNGYGFYPTFDTNLSHCEAAQNGKSGFSINSSSIRGTNCKAFLNGQVDGVGAGFEFGPNAAGAVFSACEAQNNKGQGVFFNGCSKVMWQGICDSNSFDGVGYSGVELAAATYCIVNVVCWQGKQNGVQVGNQSYAVKTSGTCTGSQVTATHSAGSGATIGANMDPASTLSGSGLRIAINGISYTAGGAFASGVFGDASDGTVTFDGTASISGASRSGSVYTLTRDLHTSTVTINSGVTLNMGGFRLFCQGVATNNGGIAYDGNPGGANGVAGAAVNAIVSQVAGGAGNTGAGTAGSGGSATQGLFGVGAGGLGGTGSSGAGGAASAVANANPYPYRSPAIAQTATVSYFGTPRNLAGGASGGGGGGDGTNKGGAGGTGGGSLNIFAASLVNNGTITARGGAGGTPTTGNCGGGAGGGGGIINIYSLSPLTGAGTTDVTGGAGGAGVGTGTAGANGGNGTVNNIIVA